jgi:DNA polymerase I-like protein with 3'-5' exonuclease and polymerase domains
MKYPNLQQFPYFALDTETTGLVYLRDEVFGFSVSTPDGKDYYYDVRKDPKSLDWLRDQLAVYRGVVIFHNASFDVRMLDFSRVKVPLELADDTVIRACCIDEHLHSYDLDNLGKKYCNLGKIGDIWRELADIFGGPATRNVQAKNLQHAPIEIVGRYAKRDTRVTLTLWEWQNGEIERQGIYQIIAFERGHMPRFIRAEMRGVRVDLEYAEEAADRLTPLIADQEAIITKHSWDGFNSNSPKQMRELLQPKKDSNGNWFVGDQMIGKTPSGNPSLGADTLRELKHPAAQAILEVRSLIKTRDTFLRGHVLGHSVQGRVYPSINQSKGEDGGTGTGRLSYTGPALQQIPSRNKVVAAIVKPCFLPDEGHVWVDGDMNSYEVRIFAHLIKNPRVIAAYKADPYTDFHQFVADLTRLVRNATYSGEPNAKQLNLSMIFNSGDGAIAEKMGMPWSWESFLPRGKPDKEENYIHYKKAGHEAKAVIAKYHRNLPGVKELADKAKRIAEDRGYVQTMTAGRRLRFPRGYKSYSASGLLIQATSADVNKDCWGIIEEQLGDFGHLILNTHDSYGMSIVEDWVPHFRRVKKEIEDIKLNVPLILDLNGVGKNWWEALNWLKYKETKDNALEMLQ